MEKNRNPPTTKSNGAHCSRTESFEGLAKHGTYKIRGILTNIDEIQWNQLGPIFLELAGSDFWKSNNSSKNSIKVK
jgi:hypothetical protein